jgi:hypothetical protein
MKRILPVMVIFIASTIVTSGQAPHAIKYQAVVRDTLGIILSNQDITVRITILSDSMTGTQVYQETHSVEVNSYGLINLAIGTSTVTGGDFTQITWDRSEHFLPSK